MKTAFLFSVALLVGSGIAPDIQAAIMMYDMNVAPDQAPQPFSVDGSTALRSVTNGVLRVNDDGFGYLQYRFSLSGSNRTVEARLRIDYSNPNGSFGCAYLGFLVPYPFEGTYVYLETNRLSLSGCYGNLQHTNLNLANGFHVIRLAQDATGTRLFVDSSELFSCTQYQNAPDVSFGAASIPALGDSYWDYVAFTDTGAFAPEEFSFVAPRLTATRQGAAVNLSWNSLADLTYQVEFCSNLTTRLWAPLGDPIPGNGSTNRVVELIPQAPARQFFRVMALP